MFRLVVRFENMAEEETHKASGDKESAESIKRICLFCDEPATSAEHFILSAIGGTKKPRIVCVRHNGDVNRLCDEPLIRQLGFFVHALHVKKDRSNSRQEGGDRGASIEGVDAYGNRYVVDRDRVPQLPPKVQVVERDVNGRPRLIVASTAEAAKKFIKSTGADPSTVKVEERTEALGPLNFSLELGDPSGFPGILKIAYEYVRGYLVGETISRGDEKFIHPALLEGTDASDFVRWLPFTMLPGGGEAEFFSHRLVAWFDGVETLVIVELFNCLPFVVRLPGVKIQEPALFIQGIQGEQPLTDTMRPVPTWSFKDVPEHAQPSMMPEFKKRSGVIVESLQFDIFITAVTKALIARLTNHPETPDHDFPALIVADCERSAGQALELGVEDAIKNLVPALLAYLRAAKATGQDHTV